MARPKRTPLKSRSPVRRERRITLYALGAFLLAVAGYSVYAYAHALDGRKPATVDEIKELLAVTTQRTALSTAAADAMVDQLQKSGGTVNPKIVQIIPAEVDAFFADAMTQSGGLGESMAPVFAKRFSSAEVHELLDFYRSPLGRKLADEMPVVAAQTAGLAQKWTMEHWSELSQRVEAAFEREGIELPAKAAPPAPPLLPAATAPAPKR